MSLFVYIMHNACVKYCPIKAIIFNDRAETHLGVENIVVEPGQQE